ncbi:MAG: enoyl-CoA hydratase-related protein [Myxococcota bacterium]
MTDEVLIRDDGPVRYLMLNRPETRNGLTLDVVGRLKTATESASSDAGVRALVFGGEGGAFCSGLDLRQGPPAGGPAEIEGALRDLFHGLIAAVDACPKPTVALIEGPAAGFGISLALACDLRVATERASFAVSFARIGLCPDGGATYALPRAVGLGKALELILLAERIDAAEAHRIGLVERLVPAATAREQVAALAARLAAGPPLVQRQVKELCRRNVTAGLAAALEAEVGAQMRCLASQDFGEGIVAFMQKREPKFRGE